MRSITVGQRELSQQHDMSSICEFITPAPHARRQALDANKIRHVKLLGGSGAGGGRLVKDAIRRFTEDESVSVLLLSTQKQVGHEGP